MPSKQKLCMYKMFKVTAETFAKNCVHTIKVNKTDNKSVLWIKMIDIQKKLDVKNIHDLVDKEMLESIGLKSTVLESIKDVFEGEDMQTQYSVIGYRVGVCFYEYKLPMEVDELGHNDRNIDYEIQRERVIEKQLGCVFIRVNPDEGNFNIFSAINQIHRHIKKSTKKSLIEKISKRLLKLEFKSNHSIITKSLKRVVKKLMPDYKQ